MAGKIKAFWDSLFGKKSEPNASVNTGGSYRTIFTVNYDGEKNMGEMGPIRDYRPDYLALRARSWQAYLDSDIAQTIIKKYNKWVIGAGLKLQAEPVKKVLESEGIKFDTEKFNEVVEARFGVYAKSVDADFAGMKNLHRIAKRTHINAIVGGDVLVILRYIDDSVKVQLVDGAHVVPPITGNDFYNQARENGNRIQHGIELSPTGKHVAYYVKKPGQLLYEVERIPARSTDSGLTVAFLVYGLEYRLDNHRGLPLISAVMEEIKKLDRYKDASVGKAEEVAKVAYQVVHQLGSTGENPLAKNLAKALNADAAGDDVPRDIQGKQLADTVAVTTNKQAFNNPIGSEIKTLTNQGEIGFKDFFTVNRDGVCSAIGIPPEVAMSIYNSNFSASRAALKDWEHTLGVDRTEFSADFYQHVYNFFLDIEILRNKVQAPGYLLARLRGNSFVLSAYRTARFVGASVPHIDPLKEVNAERAKLGPAGAMIPLTTVEAATESLNGGDSDQNIEQFAEEMKQAKKLGVIAPPKKEPAPAK